MQCDADEPEDAENVQGVEIVAEQVHDRAKQTDDFDHRLGDDYGQQVALAGGFFTGHGLVETQQNVPHQVGKRKYDDGQHVECGAEHDPLCFVEVQPHVDGPKMAKQVIGGQQRQHGGANQPVGC